MDERRKNAYYERLKMEQRNFLSKASGTGCRTGVSMLMLPASSERRPASCSSLHSYESFSYNESTCVRVPAIITLSIELIGKRGREAITILKRMKGEETDSASGQREDVKTQRT